MIITDPAAEIAEMKKHAGAIAAFFEAEGASPEGATASAMGYLSDNAPAIARINAVGKALHGPTPPSADAMAAMSDMQLFVKGKVGGLMATDPALAQAFGGIIAKMRA